MGLKVAIIGLAASSHDKAPWDDPTWEKWGLAWDAKGWPKLDRAFEPHDIRFVVGPEAKAIHKNPADYLERLQGFKKLYMQKAFPEVPNATVYPIDEVTETIGAHYYCSSIAYMLALAIHEGAEEIGVWGVEMRAPGEYWHQRPNTEYLIGFARARGIKVYLPPETPLCQFWTPSGEKYFGNGRYGWLG